MNLERKILRVEGAQRAQFLNDILTIKVEEEMELRYGALLSAQGKIQSDLFIWSENSALFLDLPQSQYQPVKTKLGFYKLRADVELFDDERQVIQTEGEGDPRGQVGKRIYGSGEELSVEDYQAMRIAAYVPEFGIDFDTNMAYPREWRFDEMGGIDYKKGCFVGQEIVARMRHKSELLKSVVRIEAEKNLIQGTRIQTANKEIGEILSTSQNQALAFLRLKGIENEPIFAEDVPIRLF